MPRPRRLVASRLAPGVLTVCALAMLAGASGARERRVTDQAQVAPAQFGGSYSSLGERRQKYVKDWLSRFNELTGLKEQPEAFYDEKIKLSAKTTFEAITNALMTTTLTETSGGSLGDALTLVESVDSVRGAVVNAAGDHQFRMYVLLTDNAIATLERTQQFARGADNTVFHKGYPINYRQTGGSPSIQISIARDKRHADIDVDYRSSSFPIGLFNGHLTSANSDVRAGNNFERHTNRWSGFQNWWRNLFGIGGSKDEVSLKDAEKAATIPTAPRVGDKAIEVMVDDFLRAWLVDGDLIGAMSYVSQRAYACLAQDFDDRAEFDRGMAPYQLLMSLKRAHDALGKRDTLDGLLVGVRLATPGLKVVQQPHHAQFVVYSVPDDIALKFDCESRLTLGSVKARSRTYGRYYGATFLINGRQDYSVALLWAKEDGHFRIVSWQTEADQEQDPTATRDSAVASATAMPQATATADPGLVAANKEFLESWLIRKNYDAAMNYLAPSSYACSDSGNDRAAPKAGTADSAQRTRGALERAGELIKEKTLAAVLAPVATNNSLARPLRHAYSSTFTLASVPNRMIEVADCSLRGTPNRYQDLPPEYGLAYASLFRFRTESGETPVLRLLWVKTPEGWRISAYDVEYP